jgi:thiol:disulfide interchange protein
MYASAAWLVWVLSQQAGPMGVLGVLMGMVAISFGVWLLKHRPNSGYWKAKTKIIAVIAFISAIALLPAGELARPKNSVVQSMEFGETYTPEKLEALLIENSPIFVEMTAAWCITCKVNHAIAINTDATKKLFAGTNIRYLIGDWTNQDPVITKYLNSYGRNGVPIYVYYGPTDAETGTRPDPKVLPQMLTPGIVRNAITHQ